MKNLNMPKVIPKETKMKNTPNGTVIIRMPKTIHELLVKEAEREGTSLNQLCIAKLAMRLKKKKVKK